VSARPAIAIAEELLSEAQAVARIPGRDSEVRAWLQRLGIARRAPTGGTLYRWSEIVTSLPLVSEPVPAAPRTSTARATLPRSSRV